MQLTSGQSIFSVTCVAKVSPSLVKRKSVSIEMRSLLISKKNKMFLNSYDVMINTSFAIQSTT